MLAHASTATTHPLLVLLLSDPAAGGPARAFADTLAARTPEDRRRLVPLGELRRAGLDAAATHPLYRAELERFLAREITTLIDAPLPARARIPIFLIGNLSEPAGRRHVWSLLRVLGGALSRVALPRGVDAILGGVWTLPAAWSPAEGAELYGWLKEFARALDAPSEDAVRASYSVAVVLGRSDAHELDAAATAPRSEAQLMTVAAELVAACAVSRLLDWIFTVRRARHPQRGFHAFGIEAVARNGVPAHAAILRAAADRSRILWPIEPATEGGEAEVARAVAAGTVAEESVVGDWQRVGAVAESAEEAGDVAWLVQMTHGLEPGRLLGAHRWRRFYQLLSAEQRAAAHTFPDAALWPDPLAARARPTEDRTSDEPPPLL